MDEIRPFRPANGSEGLAFMDDFCIRCRKDNINPDTGEGGCPILADTFAFAVTDPQYPKEWRYGHDGPTCTAFDPTPPETDPHG